MVATAGPDSSFKGPEDQQSLDLRRSRVDFKKRSDRVWFCFQKTAGIIMWKMDLGVGNRDQPAPQARPGGSPWNPRLFEGKP